MKTLILFNASIKSFVRNWRSILLLIVFPLLLIYFLFSSLSSGSIQVLPGGVVTSNTNFDTHLLTTYSHRYLNLIPYNSLESCLNAIGDYKVYLCIDVTGNNPYIFDVYYDPSRMVSDGLVTGLRYAVNDIKTTSAVATTGQILAQIRNASQEINYFNSELVNFSTQINTYINKIDENIQTLETTRNNLQTELYSMQGDIQDLQNSKNNIQAQEQDFYNEVNTPLNEMKNYLRITPLNDSEILSAQLTDLTNQINDFHSNFKNNMNSFQQKLNHYKQLNSEGFTYLKELDAEIDELKKTKAQLVQLRQKLQDDSNKLTELNNKFVYLSSISGEQIVNPILFRRAPSYPLIPILLNLKSESPTAFKELFVTHKVFNTADKLAAISSFGTQRIFPIILVLLIIFLSIIVSSVMTLTYINSPAKTRISLIKGTFIPEFVSVFLSSFIVVLIPVIVVLLLGFFLFKIVFILYHPTAVLILISLSVAIFVAIGMAFSYLIKKESLTLLTNTFAVILFMFISGLIIPVERMKLLMMRLTNMSPGKITLDSFYKLAFYKIPLSLHGRNFKLLVVWFVAVVIVTLIIKKLNEKKDLS